MLAVLGAAWVIGWHLLPSPELRRALAVEAITAVDGHAHEHHLAGTNRFISSGGDSVGAPNVSRLRLYEDGRELGPSHSLHKSVSGSGAGRYSHWGNRLIFSSSDNSDPRANGRRYEATYALAPARWLVLASAALLAAIAVAAAWRILRAYAGAGAWWIVPRRSSPSHRSQRRRSGSPYPARSTSTPPRCRRSRPSASTARESGRRGEAHSVRAPRGAVQDRSLAAEARSGPIAVNHRGAALRETFGLLDFLAVQDAAFLDVDRMAGDGILVYLPRAAAEARAPLTIEYGSAVTRKAAGFLWGAFALSLLTAFAARRARSRAPRERTLLAAATAVGGAGLALLALNAIGAPTTTLEVAGVWCCEWVDGSCRFLGLSPGRLISARISPRKRRGSTPRTVALQQKALASWSPALSIAPNQPPNRPPFR